MPVRIVFGAAAIDREGADEYDSDDRGAPVFVPSFDMTTAAAQVRCSASFGFRCSVIWLSSVNASTSRLSFVIA